MRKTTVIISVTLMLIALGCNAPKRSIKTDTKETRTITERIVPRDTTIYVEGDNSAIAATLDQLMASQEKMMAKSGRSTVYLGYDKTSGLITADCECDSNAIKVRLYEKFFKEITTVEKTTKEKVTKTSFWGTLKWVIIAFVSGAALVFIILLIRKFIP